MMRLSIKDILSAAGGRLLSGSPEFEPEFKIEGVSTDSRSLRAGEVFFALKGERFDGHGFVNDAAEKGASGAVVSKDFGRAGINPRTHSGGFNLIEVDSTLTALGDLAGFVRAGLRLPFIAVGGSSGKTTTKEMIAAILSQSRTVLKTEGNKNNLIGLPLTILSLNGVHEAAVLELGISEPGEMERLSKICSPDIAVLTNIGRAHLEKLGSEEGVAKEKLEIYSSLKPEGVMVLNLDDPWIEKTVNARKAASGRETITFSLKKAADVEIKEFSFNASSHTVDVRYGVKGKELRVSLNSPLISNIYNAAAAIAAVIPLGASQEDMKRGLEAFTPLAGRMRTLKFGGMTVLDDTYNANPDSVAAAIVTLSHVKGRKVAILGSMFELGDKAFSLHVDMGSFAAKTGIDVVAAVGEFAEVVKEGALKQGAEAGAVFSFGTNKDALRKLPSILKEGDTVLIKGSRSARMEDILEGLKKSAGISE